MAVNGGAGRDVFVDFVNADVPEPGNFALAGGVLLIMGLFRRRSANFPRWLDSPLSYRGLDRQPPFFFRLTNTATIE